MRLQRLLVSAAVVLLTLGGCGGAADGDERRDAESPLASPPPTAGTLVVGQSGDTPPRTLWYVRIENMQAEPLAEQGFPGRNIAFTRTLKPGEYRVISWYRTCQGACPTVGEKGLSPLRQVCGAPVRVAAGEKVTATVKVGVDRCSVELE